MATSQLLMRPVEIVGVASEMLRSWMINDHLHVFMTRDSSASDECENHMGQLAGFKYYELRAHFVSQLAGKLAFSVL
jgi:hypothetical protein